jgi:Cdc6-like AAA superfamily ATPase
LSFPPDVGKNSTTLERELAWFNRVLEIRIALYFEKACPVQSIYEILPPGLDRDDSIYARFVKSNGFGYDERIVLILSLIPHIRPHLLDTFFIHNKNFDRPFTEFGGWKGIAHGGFLPTGETASFILAAGDLDKRFELITLLGPDHGFAKQNILKLENNSRHEPFFSGALVISAEYLSLFTTGAAHKPDYNIAFPAKLTTTRLTWEDLVVPGEVAEQIDHINCWVRHTGTIMDDWGYDRVLKPGYRSLFYGPPGTGKTLTATLIGQGVGMDVYRIDLSMVVSKYIGETEKNLANVFDQAENRKWVLFFDEVDALFGKRTQANSSNDRHANQEISYLLQRIEDFPGLVILATNLKSNIDEAFARRFQSVVYFPKPDAEERLELWQKTLGLNHHSLDETAVRHIASKYRLTGGAIINALRYAAVHALKRGKDRIAEDDLIKGISRELVKEGRTP